MSGVRIKPEQLADTIKKELDDLAEDTTDTVKKVVQAAADTAVKDLKATSPKRTGKYAKSWTQKKIKDTSSGKEIIVHARKYQLTHLIIVHARKYQLTHLLENGHAKRGGGRVAARVHIKPVEEKVSEKLEQDIKRKIESGG